MLGKIKFLCSMKNYPFCFIYLLTLWSRVLREKQISFQLVEKFPHILRNPKVHYGIHNCPSPVPILSQLDSVHTPTSYFLKIHLNIIPPSMPGSPKWSLSLRFLPQNSVYTSLLSHTLYMLTTHCKKV